ncbi:MAG: hypothetical protein JOZ29_03590 [Deltaproteobacteria bacterium]|nr:hypothetical protein [Deltaproteobacteria bacterium]
MARFLTQAGFDRDDILNIRIFFGSGASRRAAFSRRRRSLTSLQQRLVKTGGRLVQHARYYWLVLAESHLTRRLFVRMLGKIAALPVPAG